MERFIFDTSSHTLVCGILNITPDSFSDGGKWDEPQKALEHALEMQALGADIIDVGGRRCGTDRSGFLAALRAFFSEICPCGQVKYACGV